MLEIVGYYAFVAVVTIIFLAPVALLMFSISAHLTAAEYIAETALKRDPKQTEEERRHEDEDVSGLWDLVFWFPVHIKDLFICFLWMLPVVPVCWLLMMFGCTRYEKTIRRWIIVIRYKLETRLEKIRRDSARKSPTDTPFHTFYRIAKKYQRGWFIAAIAYLWFGSALRNRYHPDGSVRSSMGISRWLAAGAIASIFVRKKREADRKKQESEEQAEREKLEVLQEMEENLRIRAYPDEVPPVIDGDGEARG